MKCLFSSLIIGLFTLSASAQGELGFKNRLRGDLGTLIIDAPVFDIDCQTRLSGPAFLSQFYAGSTPNSLAPSGAIVPFNTGAGAGYVELTVGDVGDDAAEGQNFYVQMRAWPASAGKTYEAAVASGGKYGFSNLVPEAVRFAPGPPDFPIGLQSFCLIPEPSPLANFAVATSIAVMFSLFKESMRQRT